MDKVKFVLTFLVASGIITGGYFFANNAPGISDAVDIKKIGNKLGLSDPLQSGGPDGGRLLQSVGSAYAPTDAQGNITRMVAQSMFLKMRQMDQGGENPFDGLDTSNPETRAMIEETIRSVPNTIFVTAIDSNDLKITADNSKSAKVRYMDGVSRITGKYFYNADADRLAVRSSQELIDNFQKDCFGSGASAKNAELSKVYGEVFESYKSMVVPSSWVAMHKMILGYFKELGDIYGAFGTCKEDPIRAYVGIDRLPNVYAKKIDIQKMLNEKAAELGLH
ncbi:hypothetical protein A2524_04200 [Candidatus Wolfebacteria bacterium RIFOXYD12_FULL_48_21]|uniref:Uncharacterized protein n=1 Tax=Candidatus Wolfebacteria bacterium RIFOXYD1_FULL_48_65 TaxID=1802561 RepID=A0A1F8DZS2_9BACT|nr:MAG: hypothetical protein A2610_01835 [Candidatus Wolfebacteria bacterium RIFOXYD1_FULL_48_65]OGM95386.1 MAG: hypothetical protein A2524_04200 [Candidatus Wolfebacteria bacterium RIFOXYD12_FULL_48_21]OGM97698.1 MAG: hypothetical protein A2532_04430 [Candidatus Wolfebacteria bacterium RIFOXYD2_FULL_48_11]